MKNFAYVTTNFTGRKFMCLSLEENESIVSEWANGFSIGKIYYELILDSDGLNLIDGDEDDVLLLMNENKQTMYVEKDKFIETKGTHKILNNMWIGLN